ncbi:Ig-like domain repeat protein [Actinoplanes oblitus]|uniref:Ig-like domain repeat protein n=1 Tax=Actinoplanes oblitus TaxID=3040509 RepID=A0ABY8WHN7_9ACTN|nr:immunoglobulin-like domain-containing protein [Actinoplanes oblitus]WIM95864.1 Ig-like domain repeat protein [Actinoplanes oblitus]
MRRTARWSALSAAAVVLSTLVVPSPAVAADGLMLWYKLDEKSGTVATDSSGNGRNGSVSGTPSWGGDDGLAFNGSNTYVKLPDDIMSGLDSISVSFDVYLDADQPTPYFLYGFGNTDNATGYGNGYLFATGNSLRAAISTANWTKEQSTQPAAAESLARGTWKHLAYTQTGTTGRLFEDGVPIATNTSVTIKPGDIGGGRTTANYLGKSDYSGDRLLKGKIKDFRVYDRALGDTEVRTLAGPVVADELAADRAALTLGDTSALAADLSLPATAPHGSALSWSTSDPAVVTAGGVVTRPAAGQPAATATLTATLTRGASTATKTFAVTVLPKLGDGEAAKAAAAALVVHDIDDVRGNLTLPATGDNGAVVTWSSDRPDVIDGSGVVHRPAAGKGPATVALTATARVGEASATRTMTATVPELPAAAAKTGYLFSYFTGEGTANGEQLYFAVSKANDPLSYREVNDAKPVLTSELGTKGLRDPFIIRSPEGDKFYQIATDLKINGNGDWDGSQRRGSKSIMVWESTDLVTWTNQRLVKISPDTAGNTWAPEAFYDRSIGAYVVFWASKLYDPADTAHAGSTYNRMMYATTRDFYTFSEPRVWKDPGYSVIDSTMIEHDGTYYRFTKDERNNTSSTPCAKFLIEEKSTSIMSTDYQFVRECIGSGAVSAGEGPLVFKSNTEDRWYLFIDEFGGQGYVPFTTTDLAAGLWTKVSSYSLPASPRHGTVLPVTQREYDRLLATYQPNLLVTAVDPVPLTTPAGTAPALPARVTARHADGSSAGVAVVWDAVPPAAYARPGTFTVSGTIAESQNVKATAVVTVPDVDAPTVGAVVSPAEPGTGWFRTPATVTVTATDAVDGAVVPKVRVTRAGEPAGPWVDQAQPLTLGADGIHVVEYTATDAAGNSSGTGSVTVRVDTTAPVSQATVDADARTVSLRAADGHSGVRGLEYSLDGGATWWAYTGPVRVGRAATALLYRATDVAGNVETANRVVVPAVGVVPAPTTTRATVRPAKATYGTSPVVDVTVAGASAAKPSGVVRVLLGATSVGDGVLSGGHARIQLANTIGVGTRKLRVVYAGDDRYAGSSAGLTLEVVAASSRTTVSATAGRVRAGGKTHLTVRVRSVSGAPAYGTVRVLAVNGTSRIRVTATLTGGRAVLDLGPLTRRGTYRIEARYSGSGTVTGSASSVLRIRVVR